MPKPLIILGEPGKSRTDTIVNRMLIDSHMCGGHMVGILLTADLDSEVSESIQKMAHPDAALYAFQVLDPDEQPDEHTAQIKDAAAKAHIQMKQLQAIHPQLPGHVMLYLDIPEFTQFTLTDDSHELTHYHPVVDLILPYATSIRIASVDLP